MTLKMPNWIHTKQVYSIPMCSLGNSKAAAYVAVDLQCWSHKALI